jgi:hypothetical protein
MKSATLKILILNLFISLIGFSTLNAQASGDPYEKQLRKIRKQMEEFKVQYDVLGNPFQVGDEIPGYPADGGDVFLKYRDLVFQLRANPLTSTGDLVEYNARIKGLISAGNGMLLRLLQSIKNHEEEGINHEESKKQAELLKILRDSAQNVANAETDPRTVLIDNFELAGAIFKQNHSFKVTEATATFQLIQLIYLEVIYQQNLISWYEIEMLIDKNKEFEKTMKKNLVLTKVEKDLRLAQTKNVLQSAKKRILERKYDSNSEFEKEANVFVVSNREKAQELIKMRRQNGEVFGNLYDQKKCGLLHQGKAKNYCKNLESLNSAFTRAARGEHEFIGKAESKLPKEL